MVCIRLEYSTAYQWAGSQLNGCQIHQKHVKFRRVVFGSLAGSNIERNQLIAVTWGSGSGIPLLRHARRLLVIF